MKDVLLMKHLHVCCVKRNGISHIIVTYCGISVFCEGSMSTDISFVFITFYISNWVFKKKIACVHTHTHSCNHTHAHLWLAPESVSSGQSKGDKMCLFLFFFCHC